MAYKEVLKAILPRPVLDRIRSRRYWNYAIKANIRSGRTEFAEWIRSQYGDRILGGPFKGIQLPSRVLVQHAHFSIPQLLGAYECEIFPWLEELFRNQYERVVDVGSGNGYYAVCLAGQTGVPVYAYETDQRMHPICAEMARLNGVEHLVRQCTWASQETMHALDGKRCLILSDCEGYERVLFTAETARWLRRSDLIIELHDHNAPRGSMHDLLSEKLSKTHTIDFVAFKANRDLTAFPYLGDIDPSKALKAITEDTRWPDQEWMLARAQVLST